MRTLDDILGDIAALVDEAYELGRRETLERMRAEADRLLNVDRPAPRIEVERVQRVTATAIVTPAPEPPRTGVDMSALRPDPEDGVAPEGEGAPVDIGLPAVLRDPLPKRLKPWAEDDAELRRLHADGKSDQEIGDALGRTPAAIAQRRSALGLRRAASFGQGSVATRLADARAESAQALERARASVNPTIEHPDPAPAAAVEPVAAVAPPTADQPPQKPAPVVSAPDTEVDRAVARLERSGCKVKGPILGLWHINDRPHTRAELLARADRTVAAPVSAPHRAAPTPARPAAAPIRAPVAPRPLPPSRTDELAEIERAIASGHITIMPSGAELGEIMRGVPAPIMEACVDWAEKNGVKIVRGTRNSRVGNEDCLTSEIVPRVQQIARDRALDAWRTRKLAAAAHANGPTLADVKDRL